MNYSQGYDAGVTVNLAGGGPSGGNADSIVGFTNAVGTAFADNLIGTDLDVGNSLKGGKGNDSISGNNGPDFVLGGAGNDGIRGGAGEDTLKGQGGKDNLRGAGGADDLFGGKGRTTATVAVGRTSSRPARSPRTSTVTVRTAQVCTRGSEAPRSNGAPHEFRVAKGTGPLGGRFLFVWRLST